MSSDGPDATCLTCASRLLPCVRAAIRRTTTAPGDLVSHAPQPGAADAFPPVDHIEPHRTAAKPRELPPKGGLIPRPGFRPSLTPVPTADGRGMGHLFRGSLVPPGKEGDSA